MSEREKCGHCRGTGECQACGGHGCCGCDDSGECQACDGTGNADGAADEEQS